VANPNVAPIVQCLSRNNIYIFFFSVLRIPYDVLSTTSDVFAYSRWYAYSRLKTTVLENGLTDGGQVVRLTSRQAALASSKIPGTQLFQRLSRR
jgi:hypothetical protein